MHILRKRRQLAKPWLTKGVLTKIKHRQKLYESHFLSRDPEKVKEYKLYANTLNIIKNKATISASNSTKMILRTSGSEAYRYISQEKK